MKVLDLKIQLEPKPGAQRSLGFGIRFEGELTLTPGSLLGVYGPNGVGKSSLMKGLAGHLPPRQRSGFVFIETQMIDLSKVGPEWAQNVLYLASEIGSPFPIRVLDLFEMAAAVSRGGLHLEITSAERARVAVVSEVMGLTPLLERSIHHLSDGEKQWVMIARGLIQQPRLLLLDETCSKLDLDRWAQLHRILRGPLIEKTCVWLCSHELHSLCRITDQLLIFGDGVRLIHSKTASKSEILRLAYPHIDLAPLLDFLE